VEDESLVVVEGKLLGPVEKIGVVGAFPEIPEGVPRYREKLSRLAEHTHTHAGGKSRRLSSAG